MRVSLNQTIEVTDEQRKQLADVFDEKQSRRKATRDECRDYLWQHGAEWEADLQDDWCGMFPPDDDEDLIGSTTADEPDLDDLL